MFGRLSFRLKLLALSTLALASLAGLLTIVQNSFIHRTLNDQLLTNAEQHRPFFVAAFSGPLLTRDYAAIRSIVDESVGAQRLAYLLVKDGANRVVAVRGWDTAKARIPPPGGAPVDDPAGRLVVPFEAEIRIAGQLLGTVCFGLSYEPVAEAKRRLLLINAAVAIAAFIVIVLLIEIFNARLTRPLKALTRASDQIGAGNFDIDPPPPQRDEFGRLAAAFHRMSAEIKQRIATLTASEETQRRLLAEAVERAEQLRLAKELAEQATRAKTDFLAHMSHELRTPLNAIIGFSELMQTEAIGPLGNPRYKKYCADIRASGAHLLAIINDILDLTRVEGGHTVLHEETVEIAALVGTVFDMARPLAAPAGIRLATEIEPALPPVACDPRLMRQVLLNLVGNAIKFSKRGGRVTVSAAAEGGDIVLRVADQGIGIAAQDLAKVMLPFGQVESVLSRRNPGTGLGLPLARRFVELHGGRLVLASELGRGTTVTVTLPGSRAAAAASRLHPLVA